MKKDQLTQNIEARIAEVAGYQTNIDNYTRMIAKIGGEWCAESLPFKGLETQDIAKQIEDEALIVKVADLNFKEKLTQTLRTERLEQRKALLVLEVLQDQAGEV